MKRTSKKLTLSKHSIRVLARDEVTVAGGLPPDFTKVKDTCGASRFPPCQDQGATYYCYTLE
jgi:hypothetical protein